tara:strand:- start:719 stop:1057 length:339 start_codon:yes stop_codon:yes gene_type:complete
MPGRYENRTLFKHSNPLYRDLLEARRLKKIHHYNTPKFKRLTDEQIASLDVVSHIWKVGDRYYKLASEYYDDTTLWWVIAWFNHAPVESHLRLGDVIYIPLPLYTILNYYDY